MKRVLLIASLAFYLNSSFCQDIIYWSGSSANGSWDWGSGCFANAGGNWYWSTSGTGTRQRPDCNATYNKINFDNAVNQTMDLNSGFDFSANQLLFITGTGSRTISTSASRSIFFSDNNGHCKIENYVAVTTHVFNVNIFINGGGNTMEINPVNGYLTFNNTITNNSDNAIQIYGNQVVQFNGNITGTPGVTVNGNATAIYSSTSKTYAGTTTINNGATLRISSSQSLGAITLNTGGKLTVDAGVTLTITGAYSGGGTLDNKGTIILQGSSAQNFPGASTTINNGTAGQMTNLTVNNAAGVTLNNSFTVTGALILTTGQLSIGTNTLTLNGTVSGSGTLTGSSTSSLSIGGTGALGTLNFTQTTDGTTNALQNFILNRTSSGTAILGNKLILISTFTPTAGTFASGGNLNLRSTASGTARIGAGSSSGGYITGNVVLERYVPARRAWRFLTAPITTTGAPTIHNAWQEGAANASSDPFPGYGTHITGATSPSNGFDLNPSKGASCKEYIAANWQGVANTDVNLMTNQPGYMLFLRGSRANNLSLGVNAPTDNTTLRITGQLKTGTQTFAIAPAGYTMIGNPFASAIDMHSIATNNSSVINDNFQLWDPKMGGSFNVGGFVTVSWNGSSYNYSPAPVSSLSQYVQSGSALFVQANSGGTLTISETDKSASGSDNVFNPTTADEMIRIDLRSAHADGTMPIVDGVLTTYNTGYSNAIDKYDAPKLANFSSENISMLRSNSNLSIERRDIIGSGDTIFLNIANMATNNYQLDLNAQSLDHPGMLGYLEDSYTGVRTSINLSGATLYPFSVTGDAASFAANRFRIVFGTQGPLPVNFTNIKAYQQGTGINVEWEVGNQLNIRSYEIERSADGRTFSSIGNQQATGINGAGATYNWMDNTPVNGVNFYRIRSIEFNTSIQYSSVVKVNIGKVNPFISIYPNPVMDDIVNLQLSNMAKGVYSIRIMNSTGQALSISKIIHNGGSATQSINLDKTISKGTYELEITGPDGQKSVKSFTIVR